MLQSISLLVAILGPALSTDVGLQILTPTAGTRDALVVQPGSIAPSGVYTLSHGSSELELTIPFPILGLQINDIKPVANPLREQEVVCCPPGTVFDGRSQSCVFLASSVCPEGFGLDAETKSVCINVNPPCPNGLNLDGGRCVSPDGPHCVDDRATYNNETHMCEATVPAGCDHPLDAVGDNVSLQIRLVA